MIRRRPAEKAGRRVDLHAHTHFSDGQLSPAELVDLARERGLATLAITDHDTVEGIAPAREAAQDSLELIPGIEISTSEQGVDLHVLGYFVDPSEPAFLERLRGFREERRARVRTIVARLAEQGAPIDADEVFAEAGPGVVGRPHVAARLVAAGHVESTEEAFQRFLSPRGTAYVPRPAFTPTEAITLIRSAGGVAVLAHPALAVSEVAVERLVGAGLAGVEVWHPQHGLATRARWRRLAHRLGLVESGGSDFHGPHRGAGLGDMPVPARVVDALRARASSASRR